MSDGSKHGIRGQYQRVVGQWGVELISESLTDVENRLQESAAGRLRTEYAGGNWKEMVGMGARRMSTVC